MITLDQIDKVYIAAPALSYDALRYELLQLWVESQTQDAIINRLTEESIDKDEEIVYLTREVKDANAFIEHVRKTVQKGCV